MRKYVIIFLGVLLALNIWLVWELTRPDGLGIREPQREAHIPALGVITSENVPKAQVSLTPTQFPQATPTRQLVMVTRTPLVTPTDYFVPSSTRHSNQGQGTSISSSGMIIGHSVSGIPLIVNSFGTGSTERMIVAGIHGGYEWNTIALADQLIEYLKRHPETIPSDKKLYILRALNPDGEARSNGIEGRANENGVDLNRNFPSHWQRDWPRDGCWNYGPINAGTHPASEPETVALMNFISNHNIDALISYHSAALGIFPGGQPPDSRSLRLAATIASISNYPYPPIDTGCQFTGQLIDWASDRGIAAIDIELTNHENTDFEDNLLILTRFLTWEP